MAKKNILIKIFASPKGQKTYDKQDEKKVKDIIKKEVLSKAKDDYHSVSVKVKRAVDGTPESLIAYLLRQDTYTADIQKVGVDKNYKVTDIEEDYDDSDDVDDGDDDEDTHTYDSEEYGAVDFVAATPVPEIDTAKKAVKDVHLLAQRAGLNSRMLLGRAASIANYKRYLCSGVQGFVNIGHGSRSGIVLDDGVLNAAWFRSLRGTPLTPAVAYFNSCQVYNPPLQPAVMESGARSFIGGIVNLLIGPSEEVCKCFWNRALIGKAEMGEALSRCELKHYPRAESHGISGDRGQFFTGEVIVFEHSNFRGRHRHIYAMENNLNHPSDRAMNDRISSFVVVSGTWKFYQHSNFRAPLGGAFTPGAYKWVEAVGVRNDQISSMKCIHSGWGA
jgi:hypothetical protein